MINSIYPGTLGFDIKSITEAKGFGIGLALVLIIVTVLISKLISSRAAKKEIATFEESYGKKENSESTETVKLAEKEITKEDTKAVESEEIEDKPAEKTDDCAVVAAITASISLILESEGKSPKGFRVVSFRRSKRKN